MRSLPTKYDAPEWSAITADAERRAGIPAGLLHSVVNNGERSNSDQVSEAGARTPYQIIPSTAKLIEKKYGIDPMLSPENAALGAAYLLKESMDRNNGNPALAVAEYHGGTDRNNWGRKTKAYVGRVMTGYKKPAVSGEGGGGSTGTTEQPAQSAEPTMAEVHDFYLAGKMSPEAKAEYEADIQAGIVTPPAAPQVEQQPEQPQDAQPEPAQEESNVIPVDVAEAYRAGQLSGEAARELEADVASGLVKMPVGYGTTETGRGIVGGTVEAITGAERQTPETEALPDWSQMPEYQSNDLTDAAGWKASLGRVTAAPEEAVQILQANKPDVQSRKDEKGNIIIRSGVDGKEYAVKPGFTPSDIPRAIFGAAAFTPAGKVASIPLAGAAAAGTQAIIEGTQAATGGEFNASEVALAGVGGSAVPAVMKTGSAVVPYAKQALQNMKAKPTTEIIETAVAQVDNVPAPSMVAQADQIRPPAAAPVAPATAADDVVGAIPESAPVDVPEVSGKSSMPAQDFGKLAREAKGGGIRAQKAKEELARSFDTNPEAQRVVKELDIDLPPDVFIDDENLRLTMGVGRSVAGEQKAAWNTTLLNAQKRAEKVMEEFDASPDIASVSESVKTNMGTAIKELKNSESGIFDEIRKRIPMGAPVTMKNTRNYVDGMIRELGDQADPELVKLAKMAKNPKTTYAGLMQQRQKVGGAFGKSAMDKPFGDTDQRRLRELYKVMATDQMENVARLADDDLAQQLRAANVMTSQRKRIEERMVKAFGKEGEGGIASKMMNAINAGAKKGDITGLNKSMGVIPQEMRPRVVMSSIMSATKSPRPEGGINFEAFEKVYGGLMRNAPVAKATLGELSEPQRKMLQSLYVTSKLINRTNSAVKHTGLGLQGTVEKLGLDGLVDKIMDSSGGTLAKRTAGIDPTGITGNAVASLQKSADQKILAAANVFSSPEFEELVTGAVKSGEAPTTKQVRKLAFSKAFNQFAKSVNMGRDLSAREQFILSAMQSARQSQGETKEGKF
jgi:hypothetical protein